MDTKSPPPHCLIGNTTITTITTTITHYHQLSSPLLQGHTTTAVHKHRADRHSSPFLLQVLSPHKSWASLTSPFNMTRVPGGVALRRLLVALSAPLTPTTPPPTPPPSPVLLLHHHPGYEYRPHISFSIHVFFSLMCVFSLGIFAQPVFVCLRFFDVFMFSFNWICLLINLISFHFFGFG